MKIVDFFTKYAGSSLTYDDLIFLPDYIDFSLDEIDLSTKLTRSLSLNIPLVSSPIDTVTDNMGSGIVIILDSKGSVQPPSLIKIGEAVVGKGVSLS